MKLFKKQDRDETLVAFDKEAKRRKREKFWNEVIDNVKKAGNWCLEHPVETVGIVMTVGGGCYKVGRIITRNREIRHDQFVKDCRHYDRKHDQWVTSKRKLTNDELAYMERCYDSGISKRQVLEDLGLLK